MPLVRVLSIAVNIYMMVIVFRIILTWFPGNQNTGLFIGLSRFTDPYLNWFRRFTFLRAGFLDLSPIAALTCLSLLNRIFSTFSLYGRISIGIILAITVQAAWGVVSFLLMFIIIILVVRLIAHFLGYGTDGPIMRIVSAVSQPVLYKISAVIFRNRIIAFTHGLIITITGLLISYFLLRTLVMLLSGILSRLPI